MSTISKEQHDELCVAYASMILFDAEHEITSEAIDQIVQASGNEVEPYWPTLFSSLLSKEGKVLDIISTGGAAAGQANASAPGAASGNAGGEVEKVEEKPKEEEEEADLGGGMDMFGGDEDY
ncbi:60s acidic ribosomal protein p1 [Plasmopara halstedii]|uniref:60s acidic ribosomal protein p1 n=1 Tax=Plasmopara halstedii TaxID=4781 RepID=A0A0P1B526_PLAHL|nr:60s acidic ribosomal protein p1 [Plasmopara halstedii]CEG49273.1 60s acidic ribosomal protein p1 [Plasmopara halstedii]|eukprot:XP_024585642.1 60s acidic ribosomal protein p1 [Plasmopara halstedii]